MCLEVFRISTNRLLGLFMHQSGPFGGGIFTRKRSPCDSTICTSLGYQCAYPTALLLEIQNVLKKLQSNLFSYEYCFPVDTPDPQFRLCCPAIQRPHLRKFKTKTIKKDTTSGFVGEVFRFVVPKSHPVGQSFPIEVKQLACRGVAVGPLDENFLMNFAF